MPERVTDKTLAGDTRFKTGVSVEEDKESGLHLSCKTRKRKGDKRPAEPHGPKRVINQAGNDFKHASNAKRDERQKHMQSAKNGRPRSDVTYMANGATLSLREKAKALYEVRKSLPIFPHADEIRQHLRRT